MKTAIFLALLTLIVGCSTLPDPSLKQACAENWGKIRIGMPEYTMVQCSFYGYHPYVAASETSTLGEIKIYRGMSELKLVGVRDGRVVSWLNN